MNRTLKVSLLIVGIFACGVVVGVFGAKRFAPPPPRPPATTTGPDGFGPNVMRRLTAELALSDEQKAAIEPIIATTSEQLRVLRQESLRQSSALIEAMNAAVGAELNAEQREKFNVLKEAQKNRMRALMEERQRRHSEGGERERPRGPGGPDRRPPRPPAEPDSAPQTPEASSPSQS